MLDGWRRRITAGEQLRPTIGTPQGNEGMPRRYVDYLPTDGFTTLNAISSIGASVLGASTLPFLWNVFAATATAGW